MRIRVLGCSGGIGEGLRTTAFLVDDDVLVDAGTGVGDLPLEALARIDHVFVSHSHLDHVACIPFLVDTVCGVRSRPIEVWAIAETLEILRAHLFNGRLWPDFTRIPDEANPGLRYRELRPGEGVEIRGRRFTAFPAEHTVPAVGYLLDSGRASLAYSGDTTVNDGLWRAVNGAANLRYLVIETAFPDKERAVAVASKHLCPAMLETELAKMRVQPEVYVTHLKPDEGDLTMREVEARAGRWRPRRLERGQEFTL